MTFANIGAMILGGVFALMALFFVLRIIFTWYPSLDLERFPFSLVAKPTEPLLIPIRKLIPPIGGVDISPIICFGICTLLREMLLGQQGVLTMALRVH